MEDESEYGGVTVVALVDELEATLESNDVRLGPEVVGELWIEQPRRAGPKTRRRLGEMACEEWLSPRERVVACLGRERSALRYVMSSAGSLASGESPTRARVASPRLN